MIIIKNSILYFIQIRHTDDFPSTGSRLVMLNIVTWAGFHSELDQREHDQPKGDRWCSSTLSRQNRFSING